MPDDERLNIHPRILPGSMAPRRKLHCLSHRLVALPRVSKTKKDYSLNRIVFPANIETWMSFYFACLLANYSVPFQVDHESLRFVVGTFAILKQAILTARVKFSISPDLAPNHEATQCPFWNARLPKPLPIHFTIEYVKIEAPRSVNQTCPVAG